VFRRGKLIITINLLSTTAAGPQRLIPARSHHYNKHGNDSSWARFPNRSTPALVVIFSFDCL